MGVWVCCYCLPSEHQKSHPVQHSTYGYLASRNERKIISAQIRTGFPNWMIPHNFSLSSSLSIYLAQHVFAHEYTIAIEFLQKRNDERNQKRCYCCCCGTAAAVYIVYVVWVYQLKIFPLKVSSSGSGCVSSTANPCCLLPLFLSLPECWNNSIANTFFDSHSDLLSLSVCAVWFGEINFTKKTLHCLDRPHISIVDGRIPTARDCSSTLHLSNLSIFNRRIKSTAESKLLTIPIRFIDIFGYGDVVLSVLCVVRIYMFVITTRIIFQSFVCMPSHAATELHVFCT